MPKRDIKKDPNIRPNQIELQTCRFCGKLFSYGDIPCPNCGRKPSDDVWEKWTKSEAK